MQDDLALEYVVQRAHEIRLNQEKLNYAEVFKVSFRLSHISHSSLILWCFLHGRLVDD